MSDISSTPQAATPTRRFAARPTQADEQCPRECSICYDSLITAPAPALDGSERATTIVNCGHVFGERCLEAWMRGHRTCPLCRIRIFTPEEETDNINVAQDMGRMRVTLGLSVPAGSRIEVRVANTNPWTMRRRSFHYGMDNGDDSSDEQEGSGRDEAEGRNETPGRGGLVNRFFG